MTNEIRDLANRIRDEASKSGLNPDQLLERFEEAGWHGKRFRGMMVCAVNPFYEEFSLSISGCWADLGKLNNGYLLWVYPVESAIEDTLVFDQ